MPCATSSRLVETVHARLTGSFITPLLEPHRFGPVRVGAGLRDGLQDPPAQLDAEPGPGRHLEVPFGVDVERFGEEEVPRLWAPARRVEGELQVRPSANARGDVQVGEEPDAAVGPGVRGEPPA